MSEPVSIFQGFPAQDRFAEAFWTGQYNRMLLAGSIRSGKTYVIIALLLCLAKVFPRSKWLITRKDWPKLRSTTMEVYRQLCPTEFLKDPKMAFNAQTHESVFANGSRFIWIAEPKNPSDKFESAKGLYINGAFPDEADGLHPEFLKAIKSRLGSHKQSWATNAVTGDRVFPPPCLLMTCNPNQGALKEEFYLRSLNGTLPERHYFQNITIEENPYVTEADKEEFKDWEKDIYDRFIKGSWDAMDDENQLIKWQHINQCAALLPFQPEIFYLGVDVARQGKDKLVYTLMKGDNIEKIEFEAYTENTMTIVSRVERFITEYNMNPDNVVVDGVGLGAGVVDRLHEKRIYVTNFLGGASPTTQWGTVFAYKNLKAQAYWALKEKMKASQLGGLVNPTLKAELASVWVKFDDKVIAVQSKDKHKERTGKSPDFADSLLYACWAKMRHEFEAPVAAFTVG